MTIENMFERAVREKLRITCSIGVLTLEEVYDLDVPKLDALSVELNELLEKEPKKSFIKDINAEDSQLRLAFNLVYHILQTKHKKEEETKLNKALKAKKDYYVNLLHQKRESSYSLEQLEQIVAEFD